ncbi:unnamed protein product [Nezara viridula]|uniref:Sulfotransferase domain-containing protein n=1 Tax=Nezara viridula TaxID=85310 RepID=A0A9P0E0K7_NEZVI|nr:unnamed protein product [Nezara viridula]
MTVFESEQIIGDSVIMNLQQKCMDNHLVNRKYKNGGCLLPDRFQLFEEQIYNMEVRPDDVWVITFPKCGTTWTQEMVWLLGNNFDFDEARKINIDERFVFLEFSTLSENYPQNTIEKIEKMKSPRFIKSHLPLSLLPKQISVVKPKIIYVYRNPKDAAISFFHHYRFWHQYQGSLQEFLDAFSDDKVMYAPFWDNVLSFWNMRHELNLLFITFEDMKKDLYAVAKRTADFMGVEIKENIKDKFLKHLSFEEMKKNAAVNYEEIQARNRDQSISFIREGLSGGWSKVMNADTIRRFEEKAKRVLAGSDFPYCD